MKTAKGFGGELKGITGVEMFEEFSSRCRYVIYISWIELLTKRGVVHLTYLLLDDGVLGRGKCLRPHICIAELHFLRKYIKLGKLTADSNRWVL